MARRTASFLSSSTRSPPWHPRIPSAKSMAGKDTGMVHGRMTEFAAAAGTVYREETESRADRLHDQQFTAAGTGMARAGETITGAGLLRTPRGASLGRGWLPCA